MNIIHLIYMNKNIIENLYKNQTYFDQYGSSIILLIIIILVLIIVCMYCYVMVHIQPIKENWVAERCNLYNIPFAGFINKPDNMSINDYTLSNFNYCTQNILTSISGVMLEPITYVISSLKNILDGIENSINSIRAMFNNLRTDIESISKEIMGRLMNIMIPIQQIIISFKDLFGKIQGTMTAGLFTLLGSYYALKSLMGAILQFIITILIAMAVMIAFFWIIPFTWGAAISMTTIFIALSIPLIIIMAFMMDVLKVQTSLSIPTLSVPSVKCFDKNTLIQIENKSYKKIIDIYVGEKLSNGDEVTAKIKVETKGSNMYYLHGIIVSDSHLVKYLNTWIRVHLHPDAIKIDTYNEPYLYCLNTKTKYILINNIVFTDWDEVLRESDCINMDNSPIYDTGFIENTVINLYDGNKKQIKNINVGDILENGEKVYGIVEINGKNVNKQNNHYLGKNSCINKEIIHLNIKQNKLYHLLTDTLTFKLNNNIFCHYNANIDLF